jgi:Transposase, Mutator family
MARARSRSDRSRARRAPMLIVADGAPGLIKCGRAVLVSLRPPALRRSPRPQPGGQAARARARAHPAGLLEALDDATDERDGKERLQALVDQLDKAGYTAAARSLADDLDALVVHLGYPTHHRRRWRSTNLLERSLGEVKRRTKVIGRFPGETSTLVQGALRQAISAAVASAPSSRASGRRHPPSRPASRPSVRCRSGGPGPSRRTRTAAGRRAPRDTRRG